MRIGEKHDPVCFFCFAAMFYMLSKLKYLASCYALLEASTACLQGRFLVMVPDCSEGLFVCRQEKCACDITHRRYPQCKLALLLLLLLLSLVVEVVQ